MKLNICLFTLYIWITSMKVSLCLEVKETLLLRHSKVNWHTFFINLRLKQKLNLRPSALFYNNLRFAAERFAHTAVYGNIYASRFCLTFFQKDLTSYSNASLSSIWILRSLSHLLLEMVTPPMSIWNSCVDFVRCDFSGFISRRLSLPFE